MKKGGRSDLCLHCFSHWSVNRRNSLTQEEVDASSVNSFKTTGEASSLEDGLVSGITWSPSPMAARDEEQNMNIMSLFCGSKMIGAAAPGNYLVSG